MSLLQKFNRTVDALLNPKGKPINMLYACKTRFGLLGTVGAGKSAIAAGIALTTQTLSSQRGDFFCRILERNSNIYGDVSNLRDGWFPEKTVAYDQFATEAGLLLGKQKWIGGYKFLQLPICDVSGEDQQMDIRQYREKEAPSIGNPSYTAAANLIRYLKQSEGYIIATDASRAIIGRGGKQVATEKSVYLHRDPDVNLVRILNEIFNYKDQVHHKIKAIEIVITKWDEVALKLESKHGIDILSPDQTELSKFMDVCYPSVSQAIEAYERTHNGLHIRYSPSFFEIERNQDGTPKLRKNGSKIVKSKSSMSWEDLRKPSYSERYYSELIEDLLTFAV